MMKRLLVFVFIILSTLCVYARGPKEGCSFEVDYGSYTHEFDLWGEVYVNEPESGADVQVYLAEPYEIVVDMVIKWVTDEPSGCGEWRRVYDEKKADFTISFVKDWHDADLIVMYGDPAKEYRTVDPF